MSKKKKALFLGVLLFFSAILLFLTHDIIITHVLAWKICRDHPQPKTFIKRTVEYPGSIYWEDNVYPGFDENDRLLMIRNYLDGVHLKTMALNGPDGKIYVYTATIEDWRVSREIHAQQRAGDYFKTLELESRRIGGRGKVYPRSIIPRFNYSVVFNPVFLTPFERRYLWSDEITITDQKANEIIAYNRRLMRRWYMILPDFALGNRYYSPKAMCGFSSVIGFPYNIFNYLKKVNSGTVPESYNSKLHRIYEGEKK